jgi:hypothetical protein
MDTKKGKKSIKKLLERGRDKKKKERERPPR